MMRLALFAAIIVCAFATIAGEGTPLLGPRPLDELQLTGDELNGAMESIAVEGQPFKFALRLTTKRKPQNPWDVQAVAPMIADVGQGDSVRVQFYLRCAKASAASGKGA